MNHIYLAALDLLNTIQNELDRGTKHRHPKTGALLDTTREILKCLVDEGELIIESAPPPTN